jgi:ABC-type bacteriocin/lantibiotic exporter with double-glycine peptidase domain
MRLLWVLWVALAALYVFFQVLQFTRRHYTVAARTVVLDERAKYLPRKK